MSAGHDGVVKEWHVVQDSAEFALYCRSTVLVQLTNASPEDREAHAMGVHCLEINRDFGAVFASCVFDATIRAYSLLDVDTCEPPPNFVFNGTMTVRVRTIDAADDPDFVSRILNRGEDQAAGSDSSTE